MHGQTDRAINIVAMHAAKLCCHKSQSVTREMVCILFIHFHMEEN